jgi:hypothetical protein
MSNDGGVARVSDNKHFSNLCFSFMLLHTLQRLLYQVRGTFPPTTASLIAGSDIERNIIYVKTDAANLSSCPKKTDDEGASRIGKRKTSRDRRSSSSIATGTGVHIAEAQANE